MNLRNFTRLIACCLLSICFFSCNSNDSTYEIGELSPDGQITNFKIASKAVNATDSAVYPSMPRTKFTIINDGQYLIFNTDSLPQHTEIRTLKVSLSYSATPASIDLVYRDKNGADSIPETSWNTSDSVQFFKDGNNGRYLPDFKVIAPDGTTRRYSVTINVHQTDPDSIRWTRVKTASNDYFDLLKEGENKTIINADSTLFYSLTNDGSKVYIYSSIVAEGAPEWNNLKETDLPDNILVESFCLADGYFVVAAADGKVYTSAESGDLAQWTAYSANNVAAILGAFSDSENGTDSELLLIINKADGTSVFAKAKVTNIDDATEQALVPASFPRTNFSSISGAILGLDGNYIIVTGGTDADDNVVNRSWMIRKVSADKIEVVDGYKDDLLEYKFGVTTFAYNSKMYIVANDSMYTSIGYGSNWVKVNQKKQAFEQGMIEYGMDKPSVVVDKDDFIWIFGGRFKTGASYSAKVWRGRLNKLAYKR